MLGKVDGNTVGMLVPKEPHVLFLLFFVLKQGLLVKLLFWFCLGLRHM